MERARRRVEADVAGDRPSRSRGGPAARAWSRAACPATRAPPAARPGPSCRPRAPPSQAGTSRRLDRSGGGRSVRSRSLCYRAATDADQPRAASAPPSGARASPAGTSRIHRRSDRRRRPHLLLLATASWRRRGRLRRGRLRPLRGGPARPEEGAHEHRVRAADGHLRPDRQGRARPPRRPEARARRRSTSCPARSSTRRRPSRTRTSGQPRASTPARIVSAGLDTIAGRPRGASTITQQLVRARLLPPEAFEGSTYERKVREIIQSIRLTQAFPGEEGKQKIITAYLNQNFYGNQSYGVKAAAKGYFGKSLAGPDAGAGRDPGRHPAVAHQVRPRPERRPRSASRTWPRARSAPSSSSSCPQDPRSSCDATTSST